jgi:hypothetical protein
VIIPLLKVKDNDHIIRSRYNCSSNLKTTV